jgi:hypothetical protein
VAVRARINNFHDSDAGAGWGASVAGRRILQASPPPHRRPHEESPRAEPRAPLQKMKKHEKTARRGYDYVYAAGAWDLLPASRGAAAAWEEAHAAALPGPPASSRHRSGSVALSLRTTAHPLHTRFANMFGASVSGATVRPGPRHRLSEGTPAADWDLAGGAEQQAQRGSIPRVNITRQYRSAAPAEQQVARLSVQGRTASGEVRAAPAAARRLFESASARSTGGGGCSHVATQNYQHDTVCTTC